LKKFAVIGLEGFPLVKPGDNVAELIVEAATRNGVAIEDGDVIVVAQKIFSKAEGRIRSLKNVVPSEKARVIAQKTCKDPRFVELVLSEAKRIVKASQGTLIVEDKRGLICINAGIDRSNVKGEGNFTLLPENPDESARRCRLHIKCLTGKDVAVIVCDTYSRPFRRGQVNFAIGIAGISPFKDYRGRPDLFNYIIKVKRVAVVDEIACAAELLMGQGREAIPVVIIKGLKPFTTPRESCNIQELYISEEEDLFKNTL
jgi:coenzyme F420-0:L-glutamate ligase/coenzyme F420-1:gamma-L-glutamate ligase